MSSNLTASAVIIRNEQDLRALAADGACRVFLCGSPCTFPLLFALHPWFLVLRNGKISRWEILHKKNLCETSWEYLHKDLFAPFTGMRIFPAIAAFTWRGSVIQSIEGAVAEQIADILESAPRTYPYVSRYSLLGPNSNTFVAWVVGQIRDQNLRLPWNSFGRTFHRS